MEWNSESVNFRLWTITLYSPQSHWSYGW